VKRFIETMSKKKFDVIIVGGGITGAAVAYDAASRGFSVALVEKADFGGATSSATSKLIHGGLRYLANLEIGLVRESLKERRILSNIAPNFVYPIPIMIINSNRLIKAGLVLYDLLAFDRKLTWDRSKRIPRHQTIPASQAVLHESIVNNRHLTKSVIYHDCVNIFPERLTLAFIKSAVARGAVVANHARVENFLFDKDHTVTGVKVRDLINDRWIEIEGEITINCSGPWTDTLLDLAQKKTPVARIQRSEGIHIITRRLVDSHLVTAITPDGQRVTLMPWRGHTLIGITDTPYTGNPDDYRVTRKSITDLLQDVNRIFGTQKSIQYEDVLFAYGGLRPLVGDPSGDTYHASRKHEITDNGRDGLEGLITVEGGKYTTSRNLAAEVMKIVSRKMKRKSSACITAENYLAGCEIRDVEKFIDTLKVQNRDFETSTMEYLGRNYGTEYSAILDIARQDPALAEPINDDGEIPAQIIYAAEKEMAFTLNDIVFRRTGIGTLGHPGKTVLEKTADLAATVLNWGKPRRDREIAESAQRLAIP